MRFLMLVASESVHGRILWLKKYLGHEGNQVTPQVTLHLPFPMEILENLKPLTCEAHLKILRFI